MPDKTPIWLTYEALEMHVHQRTIAKPGWKEKEPEELRISEHHVAGGIQKLQNLKAKEQHKKANGSVFKRVVFKKEPTCNKYRSEPL
ncbi:MAG: hypothetical protein Tsb0034_21580 [Ekhidna sp.]